MQDFFKGYTWIIISIFVIIQILIKGRKEQNILYLIIPVALMLLYIADWYYLKILSLNDRFIIGLLSIISLITLLFYYSYNDLKLIEDVNEKIAATKEFRKKLLTIIIIFVMWCFFYIHK